MRGPGLLTIKQRGPGLQRITVSAVTRVFDALWRCCAAPGTETSIRCHETPAPHQDRRHARTGLGKSGDDRAAVRSRRRRVPHQHESYPHDRMRELVGAIRQVEKDHNRPIGILVDLQGPKLRVGAFAGGSAMLDNGASFTFDADPKAGDASRVHLPHPEIFEGVRAGHTLLLDDGKIRLVATEANKQKITVRVEVGGKLSDRKGVSLPDSIIPFSALTPKDRSDLDAALDARHRLDRAVVRATARRHRRGQEDHARSAAVMAKIEKPQAVARIDEIMDLTDAIMVARGDLGVKCRWRRCRASRNSSPALPKGRQAGGGRDADAGEHDLGAGADPRRGVRRRHRDLRWRRRGDAVGGVRGGQFPIEAVATMNRIAEEVESEETYHTIMKAQHAEPRRPARTPSPPRRVRSPRRSTSRRSSADVFRLDRPARRARAAAASDRCDLAEPRHRPQASVAWGIHSIVAEDAKDTADMVERACALPSRTASPRPAAASSSSPAFRSARRATNMLRIAFVGGETID